MSDDTPIQNSSVMKDGVLTVTLFLDKEAGLALALGALEIVKDQVKAYCIQKTVREAQRTAQIIRPGLSH